MSAAAILFPFLHALLLSPANAVSFNFSSFPRDDTPTITYQGDAAASLDGAIELTRNGSNNRGWAVYRHPLRLWDNTTRNLTGFTTTFSFYVGSLNVKGLYPGDGLAFFLAPTGSEVPSGRNGSTLGLFNDGVLPPRQRLVAVEFDTYSNRWDPDGVHVGIDVGSIASVVTAPWAAFGQWENSSVTATVTYDAGAMQLSAHFSGKDGSEANLDYPVDLRKELPEWVMFGFSAATGLSIEIHRILSWSFSSIVGQSAGNRNNTSELPAPLPIAPSKNGRKNIGLLAGLISGMGFLAAMSGLALFILRRRKARGRRRGDGVGMDVATVHDSDIDEMRGPKGFAYRELARATRNFSPDGKLGSGGFGEVYTLQGSTDLSAA